MYTTLNAIRAAHPCGLKPEDDGTRKGLCLLMHTLGKKKTDDAPLHLRVILDSNGLDDALWCMRAVAGETRVMRLFGVWCARQVQGLMEDPRSVAALDVAERHGNGEASDAELDAARDAAWAAARAAAWAAARAAAWDATWAAARAAARDATWATTARDAQDRELRRVLDCMDAGADPYPPVKPLAAAA